jgi:trans-aconitate methyltransferase
LELAGFEAGFGVGLVPNVAPFADGNHCRLFARILLAEQMSDVVALQTPENLLHPDYILLKTKLISFVWFAPIVTV